MGNRATLKLTIHFGGIMNKAGEDYYYNGELGYKSVNWKTTEITWEKLVDFIIHVAKISAPIRLIWFKEAGKDMKTLDYAYEGYAEDIYKLCFVGEKKGELDIFLEHDSSEQSENLQCGGEDETVGNGPEKVDQKYNKDSDEEVDRPKEDEEPEQSEDERHESEKENVSVAGDENVACAGDKPLADDGDEVVLDAGDGGSDGRFIELFEEGSKAKPEKEAYQNFEEQEAAEREAEESEEECVVDEDVEYPDTPLESDEEWEQWTNEKGSKGKMKDYQFSDFYIISFLIFIFYVINSVFAFESTLKYYLFLFSNLLYQRSDIIHFY